MTTYTITPPTAPKKRTSPSKTIFSLIGTTLLIICMFVGFAHEAGNNN
ncbi:MAG: hypothetical protein WCF90_10910 [Methanomicrobiales archaeon]